MNKFYRTALIPCLALLCLCTSLSSHAEGSKDLYPTGASGQRAYLMSSTVFHVSWPFLTIGAHYAYVNPGETIAAASSVQNVGNGRIRLTAPNGTEYNTIVGTSPTGRIQNRAEELAGPFVGYMPFARVAAANEGGIWKIEFIPAGNIAPPGVNPQALYTGTTIPNADAPWTQPPNNNAIAAWDVSVSSAGTAATIIPGRVYTTVMNMFVNNGNYYGKLFVQTNDGYTYKVDNNGQAGAGFVFFVNNKGIINGTGDAAAPTYKSYNSTIDVPIWDPRTQDGERSITHKIFYARPDEAMPDQAQLPDLGTTWLNVPKIIPEVTNISIEGVEGTLEQVSSKGGYIKFNASQAGTFRITLEGSGGFVPRTIPGSAVVGANVVYWDGKDGANTPPGLGTANITAKIQLQGAEVHFPFFDVENNVNGIILEELEDNGTVKNDIVYWNDTGLGTGTGAPDPLVNATTGLSSKSNGHKWSNNYGNEKTLDTWAYVLGEIATKNTALSIQRADLAVSHLATSPATLTQIVAGQTITYNMTVVNNGPSDVTGAPFKFDVPPGFTIEDLSDITATTSCGAVNNPLIDANGDYNARLNMPNGCVINFTITGKVGATLAGGNINVIASIMRPNDVTDPDATNPNAAVPPTDPHVECLNGGTTEECNNIRRHTAVAVLPAADIVTIKTTAATSYVPGSTVTYNITVTNNGPNDASNVNIQDNAPAGTTFREWTATVTGGVATLPNPNGSGNINETITTLPNGAQVTYVVVLETPSNFSANITNTVAVTSATTDPAPGCTTCSAGPLGPVPSADIVTTKTTAATEYVPGSTVTYRIRVKNNGPSDAVNVRIQDNAPTGTTISTWTASVISGTPVPPAANGTGNLDQTIASFPNGAEVAYDITVAVPSNFTDPLENTAVVGSGTDDPDPSCVACTTSPINAAPSADIVTAKTTAATEYVPGNSVIYTIRVKNNGPSDATDVNIQDNAPAGTTISNWTARMITGTIGSLVTSGAGNLDQTIAAFPNGAEVEYEITLDVSSGFTAPLVNTANVSSGTDDPDPTCPACATTPINAVPGADIVTAKTTAATSYVPGRTVTYTISVKNNGPSDAANVRIQDNAPAGTTISGWTARVVSGSVTPPVGSGSGDLDQTIPAFPDGAEIAYDIIVAIPASFNAALSNTATVTSSTPDPDPACAACTTPPINAVPSADIVTTKTTAATSYVPGNSVTYIIRVRNNGPSDAANVNIQDNAPAGTTISTWTARSISGGAVPPAGSGTGNLDETIAVFPNGAEVEYEISVAIPASYTAALSNAATVSSSTTDPDPTCPACITTPINAAPVANLVTTKTTAATVYVPGASVTYTINVKNNGPSDAPNVNIQDNAPAGTTISGWSARMISGTIAPLVTSGSGNLNQTIAVFPNGAEIAYDVIVDVPAAFSGNLANTVTVGSPATDPDPSCSACTTTPISAAPSADIVTTKTTAATGYVPGGSVTYTINVKNNGPSDAANVNVSDVAPTGTTISNWSARMISGSITPLVTSGSGNLNQTIASFPNGAELAYDITVAIPADFSTALSNTATVSSGTPDPEPACAACTTPPINATPSADLVTTKTTAATSYVPGNSVTYMIRVKNNGPSDAANVNIQDNAPAGTTISTWTARSISGGVVPPVAGGSGNLNQTIAVFPNGAEVEYEIVLAIPASYTAALSNTAAVSSSTTDPDPSCPACITTPINAAPVADLVTTKTTTATEYVPGASVTYTINIKNNGPSDAPNVSIQDNAPAGTSISSWTARVISGSITPVAGGSGNLNQTIAVFPNGAEIAYDVTVDVPSAFSGNLANTVTVSSPATDPDPSCPACTTTPISAAPSADIVTTKTTAATSYVPGGSVTYTIRVKNNGPSAASNVNIVDVAPTGTTISNWTARVISGGVTPPATMGGGNLNQTIATFPNGAEIAYDVTIDIPSGFTGSLVNTAAVSSGTNDPDPSCAACTTPPISAAPQADIVTVKTTSATQYVPGRSVIYTIRVTNNGPSDAAGVNIRDIAPAGTSIGNWSATVTNGTVSLPNTSGNGSLNETIAVFPNGAEVTYEVTLNIPASYSGNLVNTAAVTSGTPDPDPACTACASTPVSAAPIADIVTTKTASAAAYVPGGTVTYTIRVTNNGPSDAANVNIQDAAPAGTTISAWTARATSGTVNLPHTNGTGNLNETIAAFPDGAVVSYEVTVSIPSNFSNNLVNTAVVTSGTNDPAPGCSSCTTTAIGPSPSADIVTVKTTQNAGQIAFVPGESVVYTITVTNNGPSDATGVRIQDIAPAGTTISAWTATAASGAVTLPNASGAGNLDETIASFPNGAIVTYIVTVQTPQDYTGTMSNTATVSSNTPDPQPDCAACTTAPITAGLLNSPPIAADNAIEGKTDAAVTIPVLDNDNPGPGASPSPIDPSTIEIVEQPKHGSIRINEDGSIVYTPNRGYYGEETFIYRVQDEAGNWSNAAVVTITVTPNDLQIPNVITPNGDGNNDRFVIKGLEKYAQHEIIIFNRWNNMLFRSKNYQGDWDGKGLNAGTYFYTLKVQEANGQWRTINGYIMLMR
jgi:gliding motility-associated-like protein/uncharacterized repeat protein (TIGR01451 family)